MQSTTTHTSAFHEPIVDSILDMSGGLRPLSLFDIPLKKRARQTINKVYPRKIYIQAARALVKTLGECLIRKMRLSEGLALSSDS